MYINCVTVKSGGSSYSTIWIGIIVAMVTGAYKWVSLYSVANVQWVIITRYGVFLAVIGGCEVEAKTFLSIGIRDCIQMFTRNRQVYNIPYSNIA